MKIVHVIDGLQIGGAQTHLVTMLCEAMTSYDVHHRVISLFGDGPIADDLRALDVAVDIFDIRPLLGRRRYLAASDLLTTYFKQHQPDIVEAHLTWSRLVGLFAAWRAGVPRRIGFEQGDIYLAAPKFRVANFVGQLFADQIIVCSEALAKWDVRTHRISPGRLRVMHNCVDPSRFHPATEAERRMPPFDPPEGATRFCAAGTLGHGVNKRMDVCIRALRSARQQGADIGLVICGDGAQRATLEALTHELGIADNVRFLGTRNDMPNIMAACDAFSHAATWEPFGIVAIEAMATALPVIVPNAGGIVEAVEDGVNGLVYPVLDHEALAAAMIRLHENATLRQSMGRSGRCAAEGRFSVRHYVRRLYTLYGIEADHAEAK